MFRENIKHIFQSALKTNTMKKPIKTIQIKMLLLMFFLFLGIGATAQITLPGSGNGNTDINDEAPISSLVVVGLIAGAVYGYKKLK